MKKFWMVYVEGGKTPQVMHDSEEKARKEAERIVMLGLTDSLTVHVLQTIASVKKVSPVIWTEGTPKPKDIEF